MRKYILLLVLSLSIIICGCTKNENSNQDAINLFEEAYNMISQQTEPSGNYSDTSFDYESQVSSVVSDDVFNDQLSENNNVVNDEMDTDVDNEIPEKVAEPVYVGVTGITLTTYDVTLNVGQKIMPIVTMYPSDATNKGEIWESSDASVATVNKYGSITGLSVGTCTVTVKSVDNPEVSAVVNVTVNHVGVTGITLSTYEVTLNVGNKTMPIVTMQPSDATDKGEIWMSSDEAIATVNKYGSITGISEGTCTVTVTSTDNPEVLAVVNVTVQPRPEPVATSTSNSTATECTYIDGILIANKTYPLPQNYAPGVNGEASSALQVMFSGAKKDGISLWVCSGYRSYTDQKIIYNRYVARDGQAAADRYSARPGHSEHQTGLAFDINSTSSSFANTPQAKWLAENCYKYGFIVRYPKDKEHITGYMYEPWHIRYLGVEKATAVFNSGLCLEEFLGITSVYSY